MLAREFLPFEENDIVAEAAQPGRGAGSGGATADNNHIVFRVHTSFCLVYGNI